MMEEPPEIRLSDVEAAAVSSSAGELQSSKGLSGFVPGSNTDAFNNSENGDRGAVDPGRAGIELAVVDEFGTCNTVLDGKPALVVPEFEGEDSSKVEEEKPVKCSEKCELMIQVNNDIEASVASDLRTGETPGYSDSAEMQRKHHEREGKKEKRQRRRGGGKARNNKEISNYFFYEKKEKGLQYTRKEMEALRYEQLDYQKKKWIEVFSGLAPLVAQEYDGLIESVKNHQKRDAPSISFDPRPQFLKPANLVEECEQTAGNYSENLETVDCSAVEGVCSQDDDSDEDEDYNSIQKPAFAVTGEPDFDSGPPQDGLEYLRRVRWEAARIPKVKVAKVDKIKEQSVYMPQIPDIMKCPEHLLPLKEWEDSFLADFSELRRILNANISMEMHSVHEQDVLVKMFESANSEMNDGLTSTDDSCLSDGSVMQETSDEVDLNCRAKSSSSDVPTLSKILKMESAARNVMLRRRINLVEKMSTMPLNDGLWLFALCAAVDCPLDADTSAALRSLLRKCANLRAAKTEIDDEVIVLNMLVTISGRYFGQLEK